MAAIEIDSLTKEYDGNSGAIVAVDSVDLEIYEEEFFTIVGPSGCGKTTTLRCIAGLETPTGGAIRFYGEDVTDIPAHNRNLAMVFQHIALYPHMTVRENIAYPLRVRNYPGDLRDQKTEEAARIVGISELLDKNATELSGGQSQRAALARVLVQDPNAFLMDEPLSDLDAKLQVEVRKEIQKVHQEVEKPTVYVTHNQEEAMTMSDRIAVMNNGEFEQIGTPGELYESPNNMFVAKFIGNPSINFVTAAVSVWRDAAVTVEVQSNDIELPIETVDAERTDDVVVGFRPDDVTISASDAGYFQGQIVLIERIGSRFLVTAETDVGEIQAIQSDISALSEGMDIAISFEKSASYLFDRDTEVLIGKAGSVPESRATPSQ